MTADIARAAAHLEQAKAILDSALHDLSVRRDRLSRHRLANEEGAEIDGTIAALEEGARYAGLAAEEVGRVEQ